MSGNDTINKQELWRAALTKIELALSRPSFLTWFQETSIADVENGTAVVCVPNGFAKEWLQNKYHKAILAAVREITPEVREITFVVGKARGAGSLALGKDTALTNRKKAHVMLLQDETPALKEFTVNPETNLNPRYTFTDFVVGSFNELAHAAARSVIAHPGATYNPLFIYGGVGLGKTHLIQAIGNEALKQTPSIKVRYVPSEKFMGEIVEALKNQNMNALKEKYRAVDLLIIDDIQFMARTEKMQEEFFHTFNALYEKNKQIVISSDRPPQAIATLEERLRSRFEGGMIADIGLPDIETRLLILKNKAAQKSMAVSEEVLGFIADRIKNNIRELEGALNRIIASSKVSNTPVTVETAKKILTAHAAAAKRFVSAKKIIRTIAEFYEMNERDILAHSRKKDYVKPRQIAMYLIREELKSSYPSIGDKFSGRDHTTAMHSCEKIANELKINPELEEEIRTVRDRIFME